MLIDQIKVLMHEIPGRIEKIIYEIQALAANGQHCWSKAVHSGEEEIIEYFKSEGFKVIYNEEFSVITIYW